MQFWSMLRAFLRQANGVLLALGLATGHAQEAKGVEGRLLIAIKSKYPAADIKHDRAKETVSVNGTVVSLTNINKEIARRGLAGDEALQFALNGVVDLVEAAGSTLGDTWDSAKSRLLPAFAPIEYASTAPNLRCGPFSSQTVICFVIDLPTTRQYVTNDDVVRWKMPEQELKQAAFANLGRISPLQQLSVNKDADGGVKFIVSAKRDSYDAARILLPEVQSFILGNLNGKAFVAIPNRDFFIAWGLRRKEHVAFTTQVLKDYRSQHHPLTHKVLALDRTGLREATSKEIEDASF